MLFILWIVTGPNSDASASVSNIHMLCYSNWLIYAFYQ